MAFFSKPDTDALTGGAVDPWRKAIEGHKWPIRSLSSLHTSASHVMGTISKPKVVEDPVTETYWITFGDKIVGAEELYQALCLMEEQE